ncbi:unnamed protein product [Didymodactylos carnosus]|uniref:VPS13-like middle region domain-containing protein n=1 Tax=Didymodactylos carnosus TaxID=1234261 RepID=A0A8S2EU88_9BILA|nr:unnamed protein product [Didymodactylos carnosus]CAF4049852.1 unnamed protein product [Didymodactylos carnosus]
MRLSDKRLFQIIHHVQSLPFPETKNTSETIQKIEPAEQPSQISLSAADTMEKVEEMTPVKKIQEEQVNLLIEESSSQSSSRRYSGVKNDHYDEGSDERPFLRLSLVSMLARTTFKTYDVSFDASLADIILLHQQFVTQSGEPLRLISAKKHNENDDTKLISVHFLNTSRDNPMFKREPYNSIENAGKFHFSKLEVILQLEALLSILRFHDNLIKRLPTETEDEKQKKREQEEEKKKNEQQENDKVITTVTDKEKKKPDTVVATPSLAISAELEEFRFIISTEEAPLFDISVGGLKANVSQQPNKTIVNLILSNFNIYDPNPHAKYKKIISQQGDADELLRIDLILHNLSNDQKKDLNAVDCNVEVKFAKANIVFLFKHIDVLLSFLDTLDVAKAALELASSQYAEATIENIQKLQEQAFKLQLDVQFNAPNIFVPTNSYSNEALLLDLGKLSLRTKFLQDEKHGLIEQQNIKLENVLASRVLLNNNHDIEGEVILLDCEILTTTINRLLYPDQAKNEPVVSVKADWDLVHFKLSKGDFSCIMKVLLENFSENIKDQIVSDIETVEQYHYKSADQEAEENKLRETVLQKQHESHTEVTTTVRVRAEIKTVALTLYLGESNMTKRRQDRLENLKLADVRIEALETIFKQMNDSSYKAVGRIKNFLLDDLRETHQSAGVTRQEKQ